MKTNEHPKTEAFWQFHEKNYLEFFDCAHARTANNTLGDFDTTWGWIDPYLEGIVKLRAENKILGDFDTTIMEVCFLKTRYFTWLPRINNKWLIVFFVFFCQNLQMLISTFCNDRKGKKKTGK